MVTQLNIRLKHLMVPLLLLAGCDASITPPPDEGGEEIPKTEVAERAPLFSGPDVVVFKSASSQTVDYYCEHPGQLGIDVQMLEFPDGASYTITNVAGSHKKKISVTWSPGYHTEGSLHLISMLGRTQANGKESSAEFDVYVRGS